jgi:hypothetical protein
MMIDMDRLWIDYGFMDASCLMPLLPVRCPFFLSICCILAKPSGNLEECGSGCDLACWSVAGNRGALDFWGKAEANHFLSDEARKWNTWCDEP